ncbi:MAG: hypothetical protein ACRDJN_30310, partial [Chloroflexota bacterium]
PLVMLEPDHAELVYGPAGRELALHDGLTEGIGAKLVDVLRRPAHYRAVVEAVRRHLAAHHSYLHRIQELVAALETPVKTPGEAPVT